MKYDAEKGLSIYRAAQNAIELARKNGTEVELIFNTLSIHVSPFSFAGDIATIYNLKADLYRYESR